MAQSQKIGLVRNASGVLTESRMGNFSRDLSASRRKLIDEGLHSLLADLIRDLKVSSCSQQILQGMLPLLDWSSAAKELNHTSYCDVLDGNLKQGRQLWGRETSNLTSLEVL